MPRDEVTSFASCGNGHTIFWMEVLRPDETPYNPERFPPPVVASLKANPIVWHTQYRLRQAGEVDALFDEATIRDAFFTWADPHRTILRYQGFEFDPDKLDELGFTDFPRVESRVRLSDCRFFLHVDPKHKSLGAMRSRSRRPSEAALAVVAVAPDWHVFLVDYWTGEVSLDGLVPQLLRLYCLWAPRKITWESIGAQSWLHDHIAKLERYDPRFLHPRARTRWGLDAELPRMSVRMVEAAKTNQTKEFIAQTVLSGWLNTGVLHLDSSRYEKPLEQLLGILDERQAVDLVDCLGQGPAVWEPPPPPSRVEEILRRRSFVASFVKNRTGFVRGLAFGSRDASPPAGPSGASRGLHFRRPW